MFQRRDMLRVFAALALAWGVGSCSSSAQEVQANEPHPYGGVNFRVRGVFVTPVAGAPFTANALIESSRPLPDGTTETQHTTNLIARDNRGRIHNESRSLVPETYKGTPALLETHLFDPETRISTLFAPGSGIARQSLVAKPQVNPALAKGNSPNTPWVKEEDLGATTLEGFPAKGLRRSVTVPAASSGTGQPVVVVDEYWYSEELHMNLLMHHIDPRTGEQTVAVSNIQREEPAASLFEIPAGFKVVDLTPPAPQR